MKTIVITGAASGLGKHLMGAALAAGHRVIGLDRSGRPECAGEAEYVECDLRSPSGSQAALEGILSRHGHVDILINNAAMGTVAPLESLEADWIGDCVAVNLIAPLVLTRTVLRHMRERGAGRIVNISSFAADTSVPGTAVYGASKAGLDRSSKILQAELHATGISLGLVKLGRMPTEGFFEAQRRLRERLAAGDFSAYKIENALRVTLAGSFGMTPQEVAQRVLAFANTAKAGITIAPLKERMQASIAAVLPPSMLSRVLGFAGRAGRTE